MDEIQRNGPVITRFELHQDLSDFWKNSTKCRDEIYSYDQKSTFLTNHAAVIVGYGKMNISGVDKYYWLVQNSFGNRSGYKGLLRIEFGQIEIEKVSFSEPNIEEEGDQNEVNVTFHSIDDTCNINITSTLDWNDSLEINFKYINESNYFNYQCGQVTIKKEKIIKCYYEKIYRTIKRKGKYIYEKSNSILNKDKFIFDDSFQGQSFEFLGSDFISYMIIDRTYISKEGSQILLKYESEDKSQLPPIYVNNNQNRILKNCKLINGFPFMQCIIKEDELLYFEDSSDNWLKYNILCGKISSTNINVLKLDKSKYASFKIKKFYLPEQREISNETILNIITTIDGKIDGYVSSQNSFIININNENDGNNISKPILCKVGKPKESGKDHNINCQLYGENDKPLNYDNLYLLSYYYPYNIDNPFEIIINDNIKAIKKPQSDPENKDDNTENKKDNTIFIIVISVCVVVAILIIIFIILYINNRRKKKSDEIYGKIITETKNIEKDAELIEK